MGTLEQMILSNAIVATVLALLAAAVSSVCRRPALVHSLWLLVLIKLITPPILPVEIFQISAEKSATPEGTLAALPSPELQELDNQDLTDDSSAWTEDVQEAELVPVSQEEEPPKVENRPALLTGPPSSSWSTWRSILLPVWLAGSLLWLAVAVYRVYRFQQLLANAKPAPKELQDQVRQLAECLGLTRCPDVWLVPGTISPMIWPVGARSRLLVPAGLLDRLSGEERATLLVHELAHLRRRDHWVRALELVVTGLYWWHPVVWWARREIQEAEEQCCDAWVVWALPAAGRTYASALMETVDFLAEARPVWLPPAASGLGHFRILKRRLHMIMLGNTPRALSRAGFLAVLGLGLLLPVLPTWGQQSGNDDDKRIDKKEIIKKSVDDAIKQIDVEKIMKLKEDVIRKLDKDLKLDKDMLKKIQIEVIQKLDKDLDKIPKDVIKNLDDLIKSADTKADPARFKELYRTKDDLKKAVAQLIESRVQIEDPLQLQDLATTVDEMKKTEAQLADAKKQFQKAHEQLKQAQEQLKQVQKRMMELEKHARELQRAAAVQQLQAERAKKEEARYKEFKRSKEAKDKAEWKEKVRSSRFEKGKEPRRGDEDLEQRFEKLMKEVQDLGRELKRRRTEERRKTNPEQIEEEEELHP